MLEKNPTLEQATIESTLKSTALPIPQDASMEIWDRTPTGWGWVTVSWGGLEATGSGLIQADAAITAVPP